MPADSAVDPAQFEALEALAFLRQSDLLKIDRSSFLFLSAQSDIDRIVADFLKVLPHLSADHILRLNRRLISQGLVAASALSCKAALATTENESVKIDYFWAIIYLGLHDEALSFLQDNFLDTRNPFTGREVVSFYIDRNRHEEARRFLSRGFLPDETQKELWHIIEESQRNSARLSAAAGAACSTLRAINLPQDRYRKVSFQARCAELGLSHEIARAIRIDQIPEELYPLLRVAPDSISDGSFGNQLSQYRVWTQIAAQDLQYGIVLEDDAFIKSPFLTRIDFGSLFPDFDIMFINDRMSDGLESQETAAPTTPRVFSLEAALQRHSEQKPGESAFGADGYVLSKSGAQKLIAIAETEGFHAPGMDWYLLSHAVDKAVLPRLNQKSLSACVLAGSLLKQRDDHRLKGAVLAPSLTTHRPFGVWRENRIM